MKEKLIHEILNITKGHQFKTSSEDLLGFWFDGLEGEALSMLLQRDGVDATTESPCLKRYSESTGLTHEQAHASVVIKWKDGFSENNIKKIVSSLKKNTRKLRKMSPTWKEG